MLTPHLGVVPRPPAHSVAPPGGRGSPLLGLTAPSLQLSSSGQPGGHGHAYWVQSAQRDSGLSPCSLLPLTLCSVSIGAWPPLWGGATTRHPTLHSLPPSLTPFSPLRILLWLVFTTSACGTGPAGGHFLLVLGRPWRSLFYLHLFNSTVWYL